jgi:hypothetical protein
MKKTLVALAVLAIVATSLMAFATPVAAAEPPAAEQPSSEQPAPAPQDGDDGDGDGDYPSWVADIPIDQLQDLAKTVYDARIWITAMSLFFAGAAYLASSVWQGAPQWAKKVMQNIVIGAVVISMIPWALGILFP